jgi:hypothetical protein
VYYKIVAKEDKEVPEKYKEFGKFNDFPPNWKQITEEEFSRSNFSIYMPEYIGFRQMMNKKDMSGFVAANLFFFHDNTGVAIEHKNGKINYYKFALCEHEFGEDKGKYMFEHTYTCKKCGYTYTVDSSG